MIIVDLRSIKKDIFWLKVSFLVLALGQIALAATLFELRSCDACGADMDYGPVVRWTGWAEGVSAKTNRWPCGHLVKPYAGKPVHGWIPTGCGECGERSDNVQP